MLATVWQRAAGQLAACVFVSLVFEAWCREPIRAACMMQKTLARQRSKESFDEQQDEMALLQATKSKDQLSQEHDQPARPSLALLLTTYNEPTRTKMYEQRIRWWLSESTLPIYVVDSYNLPFSEGLMSIRKFREYHFDQTQVLGTPPRGGSTGGEILSMKKAFDVFKAEWAQYDYVVKITGKYVLPTLTSAFATVSKGSAFIVQSSHYDLQSSRPGWVGTECLGFDAKRMGELLAAIEVQHPPPIESKVASLLWDGGHYSHQRLPLMPVPEAYRIARGAGDTLVELQQIEVF